MKSIAPVLVLAALFFVNDVQALPVIALAKPSGTNLLVTWAATNIGFGVQYTTDLSSTNWVDVRSADSTNGLCLFNDPLLADSRYYRLTQCGYDGIPDFLPGKFLATDGVTSIVQVSRPPDDIWNYEGFAYADRGDVQADGTLSRPSTFFDASDFIDPQTCGNGSLSYNWVVVNYNADTQYHGSLIQGEHTPVLRIGRNGLGIGEYIIRLFVTRHSDQLVMEIRVTLNLRVSNFHQGDEYLSNPRVFTEGYTGSW